MANQEKTGIWRWEKDLPPITNEYQFTLGEGSTPCEIEEDVCFKLEYTNPTGSIKDRGMAYQISYISSKGVKEAVISSSGNAAIAAGNYCMLCGIKLTAFVNPHIHSKKFDALKKLPITVIQSQRPKSDAVKYAQAKNVYNLRQSIDLLGKTGYMTLGFEIADINGIDGVFIPVSSGTTLCGIHDGITKKRKNIPLHAVQTTSIHPVADQFDTDFVPESKSIADALVARFTPRQKEVIAAIKKTGGFGWVVSNDEVLRAHHWLEDHNLHCSYEGAVGLAGFWKAKKRGHDFKNPLVVLTGVAYE